MLCYYFCFKQPGNFLRKLFLKVFYIDHIFTIADTLQPLLQIQDFSCDHFSSAQRTTLAFLVVQINSYFRIFIC